MISAEVNSEMGRQGQAVKQTTEALKLGKNELVLGLASLIEARARDNTKSRELLDELDHDYPLGTYNIGIYAPMVHTIQAVSQGSSPADVTRLMEPALPYELGAVANLLPIYVRGASYLQVH